MLQTTFALLALLQAIIGILYHPPDVPLKEQQMKLVLFVSGWDMSNEALIDEALAVAECESHYRTGAISDGGWSKGLYQIHMYYVDEWSCHDVLRGEFVGYYAFFQCSLGLEGEPLNPFFNAYMARLIYNRSKWHTWSCEVAI